MSAVSQSYPNYLGGLNQQPDELKKPGQLVEALNVIPDPTIGLSRRPGFELIPWTNRDTGETIPDIRIDPTGTWFELELSNQFNEDYIYYGCANPDGTINMFNQDGERMKMRYSADSIIPGKRYEYNGGLVKVFDENNEVIGEHTVEPQNLITLSKTTLDYFKNTPKDPLKYCVSKNHVIFANPTIIPQLGSVAPPDPAVSKKYYSFINLKVIDVANYNYQFKRFYQDDVKEEYTAINDLSIDRIDGLDDKDYDTDLDFGLQTNSPFTYKLEPNDDDADVKEDAIVEVSFRANPPEPIKSQDGDGFPFTKVTYTWDFRTIYPGKGFKKGTVRVRGDKPETNSGFFDGKDPLVIVFKIEDTIKVLGTKYDPIIPDNISNNNSATEILVELQSKFKGAGIDKAVIVGSGLYLENSVEFSVSTDEIAVTDVINSQKMDDDLAPIARVNTVAELPLECYPGFLVEVKNSLNDKNNYFLKYVAESEVVAKDDTLTKADGFWEEVAKPYEKYNPINSELPHMVTAVKDIDENEYAFVVSPIQWESRSAGTAKDNPSMFIDQSPITGINYYKNRLFFFTKIGTVISTRAGELNNLFLNTALTVSPIDPIDLSADSNQRVPIYGSAIINNGMVLFGSSEQYMVSTSNDILTSQTANITKIANYTFNHVSSPIYLGTNIGFVSAGLTRFYEMTNLYDRGPVDINERSQQVQMTFGNRFNMITSSREQSMVIAYKQYRGRDRGDSSPNMMIYRFRQENSQESSQTSWVKWQIEDREQEPLLNKRVAFVGMPKNFVFVVVVDRLNKCHLWRMDSNTITGLPASPASINKVPVFLDGWYKDADGDYQGSPFKTKIVFPTIYPRRKVDYDITSNLTIHRVKLSTAYIGTYDLKIERHGYDTYNLLVEQTHADEYKSDYPTLYGERIETVPIYTRNKNLTLTMSTTFNAPLTLRSMTWEGDYNRPYYKSV